MKRNNRTFRNWKKVIEEDRDWDYCYIYKLEKHKLEKMLKFWNALPGDSHGSRNALVKRDLRICINLLDIIMRTTGSEVWDDEGPDFHTKEVPGGGSMLIVNDPKDPGKCTRLRKFNYGNCYRFCSSKEWYDKEKIINREISQKGYPNFLVCELENDALVQKAKFLYHKIRAYNDNTWWD